MNLSRHIRIAACVVASFAIVVIGRSADSADFTPVLIKGHPAHPTRLLAKVKPVAQASAHASVLATQGLRTVRGFELVPGLVVLDTDPQVPAMAASGGNNAAFQAAQLLARIESLRTSGLFEFVEPDYLVFADATPNDVAFTNGDQWALRNTGQNGGVAGVDIDAVRAWDVTTGSNDVVVAIIDTGIRFTHQDLAANMWRNPGEIAGNGIDDDRNGYIDDVHGINAITGSGNPMDDAGHGTHVAGTIGAAANNGGPMVGVAWQVRLMACKFLGVEGGGMTSDAIESVAYATEHGARVLNCSWGGPGFSIALRDALAAARDQGVVVVAAAGNDGRNVEDRPNYPSGYKLENIVAVAAMQRTGALADFSNRGNTSVDLGAPGVDIFSTLNSSDGAYGSASGTSMAAPHVAGVAALVRAQFPALSGVDVRDVLLNTVTPTSGLQHVTATGGRVNAYTALTAVPDGVLEVRTDPGPGAVLFAGRSVPLAVRVTDLTAVRGATATGIVTGGATLPFRDDGAAPDAVANDGTYTGTFLAPADITNLTLSLTISAPGKTTALVDVLYLVVPPPENDDFANRSALTGKRALTSGRNFGGTVQAGEPLHASNATGASVWWTWTAPASTTVTLTTEHSTFDTVLAVYTGSTVNALQLVVANDDEPVPGEPFRNHSRVTFAATAGTAYAIAVDGANGEFGSISLALTTTIVAANDMFADAEVITGATATVTGNLFNATREPGEPDHSLSPPGDSVWWSWTVPSSGTARVTTNGGQAVVYTGSSVGALTAIPGALTSGNVFSVVAGTTYRIAVAATRDPAELPDDFTLSVAIAAPPANDHFANRTGLTGATVQASGSTEHASVEVGEPDHGGASVWWTWTAPTTGSAVITINRTFLERRVLVYQGSSLDRLTAIASNLASAYSFSNSRVTFNADAGATYQIAVGGQRGDFTFDLELGAGPPNDNFSGRIAIVGAQASVVGNNRGGTRETGEPVPSAYGVGASLWWTWTAPADGTALISLTNNNGYLAVYTGAGLDTLTRLNAQAAPVAMSERFHAVAGATYHIWVDGVFGYIGEFTITVTLQDGPANDTFARRTPLTGADVTVDGTLAHATFDLEGPPWAGNSVWWTWTAPLTGPAQITTIGSNNRIAVATGDSAAALTRVATHSGNLEADGNFVFNALAGTAYQIVVDGDPSPWIAPFRLKVAQGPTPANDSFANAEVIAGSAFVVDTSNVCATAEPAEPPLIEPRASASLWWTWTAPASGVAVIGTADSDFDTRLVVYTGSALDALTAIAASDNVADEDLTGRVLFGAIAGTNYRISVDGVFHATGDVGLSLTLGPPVVNDAFADRTPLVGVAGRIDADNRGATREAGEPVPNGGLAGETLWWTWKAPAAGTVIVSATSDEMPPQLVVYSGATLALLERVTNLELFQPMRQAIFRATAGVSYHFCVGTEWGDPDRFTLAFDLHQAPGNDDFSQRIVLTGGSASGASSTRFATRENGEPLHARLPVTSVWWSWQAPVTETVTLETAGSASGSIFAVYTGTVLGSLTEVTSSMQSMGGLAVPLPAVAGTTYQIAIGHAPGLGGDVRLNLRNGQRPANDDFAQRLTLSGLAEVAAGHNRDATIEPGEPAHANEPGATSVWWTWTAPLSTRVGFSTAGSTFDTLLAIYTGAEPGRLTPVGANDDSEQGVLTSRVILQAVQGRTYQIAVSGKGGSMGAISLRLSTVEPPVANAVQASHATVAADGPVVLSVSAFGPGSLRYQWLLNGVEIPGATAPTYAIQSAQAHDAGSYSVRISNEYGTTTSAASVVTVTEPPPSTARLTNLSTRALALTGDNVLIPGFVVAGPGNKQLLIRAVGPTLAGFGVAGTLPDPRLTLKRWNGTAYEDVATNDNWGTNTNAAAIIAKSADLFAFPLTAGSADAALLVDLAPGQYSAVAGDAGTQTGIAIVELYDADINGGTARLINISNRGYVGAGDSIMIPGFVVSDEGPKTLLVRAVGPTLASFGVAGVLADPTLKIYRRNQTAQTEELILTNDDWSSGPGAQRTRDVAAQIQAFALPDGSNDAAFVVTLNPGIYTVHARGANATTGVALVEVYAVP